MKPAVFKMLDLGYEMVDEDSQKTVELWSKFWDKIKTKHIEIKSIEKLSGVLDSEWLLENWCQDFEDLLSEEELYDEMNQFCTEFIKRFPKSDALIIQNFKRNIAENYFRKGEQEQGDKAFEALIKEYPDYIFGYIGWADMYSVFRLNKNISEDIERSKELLYRAQKHAMNPGDKEAILERLADL